jgi:hypothetical protein
MKKITLILFIVFTMNQGFSYTWENFGPEGIKANNLCIFYSYNAHSVICTDSGMYLNTSQGVPNWEYFDIPAKDATLLNEETLLIIISEGSYSDGIYSFNLLSYELTAIKFCPSPKCIIYYESDGSFYVGYESGMQKSPDGILWSEVPFFIGKNCVGIEAYSDHFLVNVSANTTHLYLSDDGGNNWSEASNNPGGISDMAFYNGGEVYGIFPGNSYSSGLWHSDNFGDNWENSFYSIEMNTLCNVHFSDRLLLGWKSSNKEDEGIAVYDPGAPTPGLTFLNEGLPNKQINKIRYIELLCSGGIIFACTDNGVYQCWDYFVGIDEHPGQTVSLDIFPNPVTSQTTIKVNLTESSATNNSILIYNNEGLKVDDIQIAQNLSGGIEINWDKGDLPSGIYFMVTKTKSGLLSKKIIIL